MFLLAKIPQELQRSDVAARLRCGRESTRARTHWKRDSSGQVSGSLRPPKEPCDLLTEIEGNTPPSF